MSANILGAECSAWKRRSYLKQLKKIAFVDTRPDLYLILRFICVPLDEAHVPLVYDTYHTLRTTALEESNYSLFYEKRVSEIYRSLIMK